VGEQEHLAWDTPMVLSGLIEWAVELGMEVAEAKKNGDVEKYWAKRQAFETSVALEPKNSLGNFHISGDAAITAYAIGYARSIKPTE
jgi:hypothetical protein